MRFNTTTNSGSYVAMAYYGAAKLLRTSAGVTVLGLTETPKRRRQDYKCV